MPLSQNLGALTSRNPLGLSRPVTGLLYLYLYRCGGIAGHPCRLESYYDLQQRLPKHLFISSFPAKIFYTFPLAPVRAAHIAQLIITERCALLGYYSAKLPLLAAQ